MYLGSLGTDHSLFSDLRGWTPPVKSNALAQTVMRCGMEDNV